MIILHLPNCKPGIFSQSATNVCPGDGVTFTCETSTSVFNWAVTPANGSSTTCLAIREPIISVSVPTCGPMDEFSVSVSDDGSTSTLSAQSVDDSLNGTRIQCLDGNVDQKVCVIG